MSYRSRRYGSYGFRAQAPVEVGKEYETDILEMSHRGDAGVAKIQGFVIFVSNAKPGDHVKIKITRVRSRFATAELVR
jgi:predicted RNA-binding protein with TRAM domain